MKSVTEAMALRNHILTKFEEALTADDAADFFHLQFWHVNLCGPGSALPVPRLEILFE